MALGRYRLEWEKREDHQQIHAPGPQAVPVRKDQDEVERKPEQVEDGEAHMEPRSTDRQ